MRTINVTFTDKEFKALDERKDKDEAHNWHDFLLKLIGYSMEENAENEIFKNGYNDSP
jgi:hypothetical protein